MPEMMNASSLDWTNAKAVTEYAQKRYGRGYSIVGPTRRKIYLIVPNDEVKSRCKDTVKLVATLV